MTAPDGIDFVAFYASLVAEDPTQRPMLELCELLSDAIASGPFVAGVSLQRLVLQLRGSTDADVMISFDAERSRFLLSRAAAGERTERREMQSSGEALNCALAWLLRIQLTAQP